MQSTTSSEQVTTRPRGKRRKNTSNRRLMDVGCITEQTRRLHGILRKRIIGQDPALEALTCAFSRVFSPLRDTKRPVLTLLLLGPTGVGKTETAKALAQTLFGWEGAMTLVNCEEYAHGHEISKLLGSPPGYVGSGIEPLLSQRRIDEAHERAAAEGTGMVGEAAGQARERSTAPEHGRVSVVLFDEVEKAHPVLWNAMLGILEGGKLTLGDNSTTDFSGSIIVMTSNVGTREMTGVLQQRPLGFRSPDSDRAPEATDLSETALAAARQIFPLEFLNRFDDILVYSALGREQLERIFDKFLGDIHERALNQAGVPLLIKVSPAGRRLILDRGTDLTLGARPLRRAIEVELVDPLSRLLATRRINPGDVVEVDAEDDRLVFYCRQRAETGLVF